MACFCKDYGFPEELFVLAEAPPELELPELLPPGDIAPPWPPLGVLLMLSLLGALLMLLPELLPPGDIAPPWPLLGALLMLPPWSPPPPVP